MIPMILLAGPSASGKTEIAKILMKDFGIRKVVTHTTRPPRIGEKDGVDYHFVTREEFEAAVNKLPPSQRRKVSSGDFSGDREAVKGVSEVGRDETIRRAVEGEAKQHE